MKREINVLKYGRYIYICNDILKLSSLRHHSVYTSKTPLLTNKNSNCGGTHNAVSFDLSRSSIYHDDVKIRSLGCSGKVYEAEKVFDGMPQRDVFSYTSMITVYLKNNDLLRAESIFLSMPEKGIVAESAMISGYAKAGRIEEAQKVFDGMKERNVFSWTSLISGYFGIGRVGDACRLFQEMPEKNVVSWTTMLLGFANNRLLDHAKVTFEVMPEKNVVSWTAMLKAYVDGCRIDEARKLFNEMPQRNLYSWNVMLQGTLEDERVDEAIQLFRLMPSRNAVSWTIMVMGLARNGSIEHARTYFNQMPKKDIAAWNAMITTYSGEGLMVEASELFNKMRERNITTWNALIDGYAKNGLDGEAFKLLVHMLNCFQVRPNEITLTSVLISCKESTSELLQAHALVIRLGFVRSTSLMNALVTMYSKIGDVNSSWLAFTDLETKDVVSWTAMIVSYSIHGYGSQSLQAFARMLRSGTTPDDITFVGVLTACSHAGLVNKGQKLFDSMAHAYGLEPKAAHYSCLVDILGRAGKIEQATRVVDTMPLHERDGAVLGALLGACKIHGDVEVANRIGEELIELEPDESGGYVVLSNVFAACGKWDKFALIKKKMKERRVKKLPGFSQIDIKGQSHVFLAGDRNHPEIKQIYTMLIEKLLPLMQLDYSKEAAAMLSC
ncbi:hypothetical protein DCAR_0415587 [Daucus carota subsp. sativus]|uniref:Uncharacterized protein n=1 Tax=Daucus carota subsp. sativus TaxID=79200 RepID=A0AAF1AUV9_DAUCS|nr:PREDICTED: pentatricopeptide repeat-containing protein At1g09410-like [Daucus carota subsp. sativus]WOG96253.1 hypothetical protein DCAR_0415587 [Daucus carota subsp. sativus]